MKLIQNSCDGISSSLDVRFTKRCDNNCEFCIEKLGIDSLCGKPDVEKMIGSTLKSNIKNILIFGGEPFLYPNQLLEYVIGIRNYVDTIYITTSLPSTFVNSKDICENILNIVDGINISILSSNWIINNSFLDATSKINRLRILKTLNFKYADKIRTSFNLVKGGIDCKDDVIEMLQYLEFNGCKTVKINELQYSDKYVSFEKIMNVEYKSPFAYGCMSDIKIDGINMKLTLKRSCFKVEKINFATIEDIIKILIRKFVITKHKFRVMYENGEIKKCWKKKK